MVLNVLEVNLRCFELTFHREALLVEYDNNLINDTQGSKCPKPILEQTELIHKVYVPDRLSCVTKENKNKKRNICSAEATEKRIFNPKAIHKKLYFVRNHKSENSFNMYLAGYIQKSNYLMTDEELRQWQRNSVIWCEFDNFLNSVIDNTRDNVSEIFEESAINMAIEAHGIRRRRQRGRPSDIAIQLSDNLDFFDQQAINVAIEAQGLGASPPS